MRRDVGVTGADGRVTGTIPEEWPQWSGSIGPETLADALRGAWDLSGRPDPLDGDMEAWQGLALTVLAKLHAYRNAAALLAASSVPPSPSDHGALDVERGRDEAVEAVVAWLNELGAEALAVAVQTRHWSNKQWLSLPRYVGTETLATPPAPSDHGAELDDRRQLFISLSAMCEAVAAVLGGATTLAALADCANVARGVLLDSPLSHSLATPSVPPEETRP